MNKVERAIILAAGTGSRLQPVTFKTPKPLIKVNGKRMIETIIEALLKNGISEIHIVVGYLKEQFNSLLEKYPTIDIIDNPYYETCNNISSLYVAKDYLENVMILDGDQIIYNENILTPFFERSGYNCVWADSFTNEWLLKTNDEGIVTNCSRNGGEKGWQLYSISRWSKDDGIKLKKYLCEEFINNKNTNIYWDDIAMFCYPKDFKLGIYKMNKNDLIEIDNLQELIVEDNSYEYLLKEGNENEK